MIDKKYLEGVIKFYETEEGKKVLKTGFIIDNANPSVICTGEEARELLDYLKNHVAGLKK